MKAIILYFLFPFLLAGCALQRKSHRETNLRAENITYHADSLYRTLLRKDTLHRVIQWQSIELSIPDTLGRQYIRTATVAMVQEENAVTAEQHTRQKRSFSEEEKKELNQRQQSGIRSASMFRYIVLSILLLLLAGLFFVRRYKRKSRHVVRKPTSH